MRWEHFTAIGLGPGMLVVLGHWTEAVKLADGKEQPVASVQAIDKASVIFRRLNAGGATCGDSSVRIGR